MAGRLNYPLTEIFTCLAAVRLAVGSVESYGLCVRRCGCWGRRYATGLNACAADLFGRAKVTSSRGRRWAPSWDHFCGDNPVAVVKGSWVVIGREQRLVTTVVINRQRYLEGRYHAGATVERHRQRQPSRESRRSKNNRMFAEPPRSGTT